MKTASAPSRSRACHDPRQTSSRSLCPRGIGSHENFNSSPRGSTNLTVVEIGGAGAPRPASRCHLGPRQAFSRPPGPKGMGSSENCIRSGRDLGGPTVVEIGAAGAPRPASRCHLDWKPAGLRLCRWSRYLVNLCPARKRRDCHRHRRIESSRKTIQHLEGGIIREILVRTVTLSARDKH